MPVNQAEKETGTPLKVDYYLDNFITLIDYVLVRYKFLLNDKEKQFAELLLALSSDVASLQAARLYVRLILRTGPYFRRDKIHYNEIDDLSRAIDCLQDKELLLVNSNFPVQDLLNCLTRPELALLCKTLNLPINRQLKKQELVEDLICHPEPIVEVYLKKQYQFLFPTRMEIVRIYRLLFFGNLYQEMSEFILEDIGVVRFEKYQIRNQDRLFQSREILDQTLQLLNFNEALHSAIAAKDTHIILEILKRLGNIQLNHPNLIRRKQKSILNGARYLERIQNLESALTFYEQTQIPPARERLVRILEKQENNRLALEKLEEIQAKPIDDSEQQFVLIFSEKLKKKLKRPYKKRKRIDYNEVSVTLLHKPELRIEQQVLEYFQGQGWQGFFAENLLWNGLFGLYFWEAIFCSSPGAFFNPYQRGPKDLYGLEFYSNRKELIDAKLAVLKVGTDYKQEILHTYKKKYLTANFLVNWKYLTEEQLALALNCLPNTHLALIFKAMLKHLASNSSGFPDLFICKEGCYQLIEVKGPGDQLQLSQKRWLKRFQEWEIPYSVCKVNWL